MTTQDVIALEQRYQIPTYSHMPLALARGEGSYVWDLEGHKYLDLYGGHCVALLGHSPPRVADAIRKQAGRLLFYSNVVYNDTRARALERLGNLAPEGLRHIFFCNSGTEANETALKLARKHTGRPRILAMEGGFHGRTLGSLAVTWNDAYRAPYREALAPASFVPFGDVASVEQAFAEYGDIAAVILEPIQSMAGVVEADPAYYRALRALCDRHGAVLVFDEVQTGVGRTGAFSVSEHYGMRPDCISLAKSLGAGVPVGAVLLSDDIAAAVKPGDQGTTFGGGMIAMAAVEAALQTLVEEELMPRASRLFEHVRSGLESLDCAGRFTVRGRGGLLGVVLDRPSAPVRAALLEQGVITGGANDPNVIRLMPPINTPFDALDRFCEALSSALNGP